MDVQRFQLGNAPPVSRSEYFRRQPAREPAFMGDVITPLSQAFFTGVAVMLFTAVLGVALKWDWYVSVGTGTAVFAVTWIWLLRYYLDLLVDEEHIKPESVTPAIPAHTTRLAVTLDENRHQEVTLPLPASTLLTVARALSSGAKTWAKRQWAGNGRLLTSSEFDELQEAFFALGWLRWKDERYHQQGTEVTAEGLAGLARLASGEATPEEVFA